MWKVSNVHSGSLGHTLCFQTFGTCAASFDPQSMMAENVKRERRLHADIRLRHVTRWPF